MFINMTDSINLSLKNLFERNLFSDGNLTVTQGGLSTGLQLLLNNEQEDFLFDLSGAAGYRVRTSNFYFFRKVIFIKKPIYNYMYLRLCIIV